MSFDPRRWAEKMNAFTPDQTWDRVVTIDMHTAGEPLRILVSGVPEIMGSNVIQRRDYCKNQLEHLRTLLMWEPRGHADMYGCILTPPNDDCLGDEADFGVLFLHNEGYSSMCGHGIIAVTKLVVESEWVPVTEPITTVKIDSPAGRITASAIVQGGQVTSVSFENVPAFVAIADQRVNVGSLGAIQFDLAYGGAYYAYVDIEQFDFAMVVSDVDRLIDAGRRIKASVQQQCEISHPEHEELSFLYGTIFYGAAHDPRHHSRNVCVFADGEVDRSPTGTGVSGRAAILHARGEMMMGETITIESILGTTFDVCAVRGVELGGGPAIIPKVAGEAYFTGRNEYWIDPTDPYRYGFLMR